MDKNGDVPVDNQIKIVSDEKDGSVSDAKFKKLETGKLPEVLSLGVGPLVWIGPQRYSISRGLMFR